MMQDELFYIDNTRNMVNLFNEFLKTINCDCHIIKNDFIINDLLFKPVLNIGGYKFHFDKDDIQMNLLLGGNGTTLQVPFDYQTNDKLRRILCNSMVDFSVSSVELDEKNNEVSSVKLIASKVSNNSIDIILKSKNDSIGLEFAEDKKSIFCSIKISNWDNFIDKDIRVEYKCDKNFHKRLLMMSRSHRDRLSSDNSYSSSVTITESFERIRNGMFIAKYNTSDYIDEFNRTSLVGDQIDLYFNDLCFNIIVFIDSLKLRLGEINPTLYETILQNYPGFNDFQNMIYNGCDYGIVKKIFGDYLKNKQKIKNIENQNL